MSQWSQYGIHGKIHDILATVSYPHHFGGRPFITAYQLAIEFAKQYPSEFGALNMPIGGAQGGQRSSLSQYLAKQLSDRIKAGTIADIEGAFLGDLHLREITFDRPNGTITSSLTGSGYPLSIFRLKDVGNNQPVDID